MTSTFGFLAFFNVLEDIHSRIRSTSSHLFCRNPYTVVSMAALPVSSTIPPVHALNQGTILCTASTVLPITARPMTHHPTSVQAFAQRGLVTEKILLANDCLSFGFHNSSSTKVKPLSGPLSLTARRYSLFPLPQLPCRK